MLRGNPWLLVWWAAIALGGLLALLLIWSMLDTWRLHLLPPLFVITSIYRRLYSQGGKLLGHSSPGETPHEYILRLAEKLNAFLPAGANLSIGRRIDVNLRALVDLYARAIYSPHSPAETEKLSALNIWKMLQPHLWQMRVKRFFELVRGKNYHGKRRRP
jgi:hypothetical protein